jgi:hypothetical protein
MRLTDDAVSRVKFHRCSLRVLCYRQRTRQPGTVPGMAAVPSTRVPIPDDLVQLVGERKVIPFLGAGFSAGLGLPTWDVLLKKIAADLELELNYDEIREFAHQDNLQIAEFLYLRSHRQIGPLRHIIERSMPAALKPSMSGVHVELVNLRAPQIYTTNYDDLIEQTYRELELPVSVVTLPRDVTPASADTTQVIKYHGDLRHDETLVLTESSYYRRLDFESPMDLKFRSDLLGRSVLFMGYSFRDINIRVIWYKLTQMMRDIPEDDRKPSYIVRLEPNPVLEELDRAVGLRTITLDPDSEAQSPEDRSALLADFLLQLSLSAYGTRYVVQKEAHISSHLLERTRQEVEAATDDPFSISTANTSLQLLLSRRTPSALVKRRNATFELALERGPSYHGLRGALIMRAAVDAGPSKALTSAVATDIMTYTRLQALLEISELPWETVWKSKLSEDAVNSVLRRFENELRYHYDHPGDRDLAAGVDPVSRIAAGMLVDTEDQRAAAKSLLADAAQIYEEIGNYEPDPVGPPDVSAIVRAIEERGEREGIDIDEEPF